MQAWILTLVILSAAGGALGNWWQSADQVIMTDEPSATKVVGRFT